MEINHESRENYNKDNQIKFKNSMLRSSLCDYSDAYIFVIGSITVAQVAATALNNADKKVILKNCAPFTKMIIMIIIEYNEYNDNYSKESGISSSFYRDELAFNDNNNIVDFNENNANTRSCNLKVKLAGETGEAAMAQNMLKQW